MLRLVAVASTAACGGTASAQAGEANTEPATHAEAQGGSLVVEGRRPAVNRTIDGTTYDVRDSPQATAGTAADLLNTIPSVHVSPDGAVTVRGNGNVQLNVNGRPSAALNGEGRATTLQSMSGGSIASVEIITNPSARFGANGSTIINLTLDRARDEGLRGTATANVGDHRRANIALNPSYREAGVSASLSASLRDDVRFTRIFDDRRLLGGDGSGASRFITVSRYTPTHRRSASLSASLGYEPTPASDLGADLVVSTGSPRNTVYARHRDFGPDSEISSEYDRVRGGTYVTDNRDFSAFYERRGSETRASLKAVAQHATSGVRSDRIFTTSYLYPALEPTTERVLNQTKSRIDRVALDYDRPVGSSLRVSLGTEWKREDNRYSNGRSASGETASGPFGLAVFEAIQCSAAFYINLQARSGLWTLQAGARLEGIGIATTLSPDAVRNRRRISGMNQSAAIARSLGDDQIVARFSRTLQRFDPRDLNPAIIYIDAQNRFVGNPNLAPQRVTAVETEYDFQRGRIEGATTLYYRRTDHTIAEITEILDDNVLITTKRNGGRSRSLGIEASLTHRITNDLRYSLTANLFHADLSTPDPSGATAQSRVSYSLQGSLDWTVTPAHQLHLDANVQGPSLVPQGRRSGASALNLVWRHTLSPRLTLSLTAQGLVHDDKVHTVIRTSRALNVNVRESGGSAVLLGLSYRIR